ncbi:M43 family zinc metalloprotease [Flavobacterium sp.]|uniref:M43 family zinc metalloprotease n=1 Tax=Flavobacterium sp. TaxID=239 RepID=UPI0025C45ABF|nr:M43 family zinc metalloprotease [Flavobacterium sp.]
MKKITLLTFLLVFSLVLGQNKKEGRVVFGKTIAADKISPSGHIRCATDEYNDYLRLKNPKMETLEQFEAWMANRIQQQQSMSQTGGIIYIPVVVHVIHNGDAYGVNENITDEQVQSQITVMTQDYRKMLGTPGYNTNAVGADVQVEFVLAKVDPNGNPTNGIDRVNLCQASWSDTDIDGIVKPTTIWDPTQYMNMWSVNFSDSTLLGYAQFPESSLAGLSTTAQSASTDGVVAGYRYFGSSSLATGDFAAPYDKGRTMTHEVGHFLGLRHIWGDNATCPTTNTSTNKDFCADTPAASAANFGCVTGTDSCPSNPGVDMIQNYMDYTDDTCMNIFTNDQKTRITTVLNNSPRRATLKTSNKDVAIPLFANDAEVKIENLCLGASIATCSNPNPGVPLKQVSLYNRGTANLTSATLTYNIDGGTNYTYNWTGSLATNKYALISLPNTAADGMLTVTVTAANGTDQRASNNTSVMSFTGGGTAPTVPYYNYTTFTFTLIGDRYGTETTWSLKNAAGTTLYSGGPYTNLTSNGTQTLVNNQTWTLPTNGCYYLTVNDSYGDGINGGFGSGSYTVKTNSGAITVVNNTTFTSSSAVHYFTNNASLVNESFNILEDVVLYPNPSREFFTINIPAGLEKTGKMEIFNSIGQKVMTKAVVSDADLNVNVSNFANGVYFLNLNIGGASKTLKFIKE